MFTLTPDPTFEAPCRGFVPGQPLAGCKVTYRYKDADALREWHDSFKSRTLRDVIAEIVETWRDAPVEYGPTAIDDIAKIYPAFPAALIETYRREIFEAAGKN